MPMRPPPLARRLARAVTVLAASALPLAAVACGDSSEPSDDVAGTYQATELTIEGTYAYDPTARDGRVTFEHETDTFVRDVIWSFGGDELRATFVDSDGTLEAVLEREG